MKRSGQTHREIAAKLVYTHKQIQELVRRENKRQCKLAAEIAINKKRRPSKDCIVTEEDKIAELRYKLSRKTFLFIALQLLIVQQKFNGMTVLIYHLNVGIAEITQ
ncbi:hypothetical protein SDC9_208260 [bioreactor metagenome]|uniref:Uncharacterized protein n=1 Tax=bioreactor metagenome TaxID=1076179 RepID=A0A645JBK7_9ZZZZ